jgi:superoxide oxidase
MQNTSRYGFWLRNLHWLIAALVISLLTLVELHELAPRGSALRSGMMYWHMQFGMAVLILFLPRLIVRLSGKRPAVVPPEPWWTSVPAKAVHAVFYALMVVQPILGVLMVQAGGHDVAFLGMHVPAMVNSDRSLNHTLGEYHELCGNIFLWLVVVHALAAFWHHWGRKDNTLRRMTYSGS